MLIYLPLPMVNDRLTGRAPWPFPFEPEMLARELLGSTLCLDATGAEQSVNPVIPPSFYRVEYDPGGPVAIIELGLEPATFDLAAALHNANGRVGVYGATLDELAERAQRRSAQLTAALPVPWRNLQRGDRERWLAALRSLRADNGLPTFAQVRTWAENYYDGLANPMPPGAELGDVGGGLAERAPAIAGIAEVLDGTPRSHAIHHLLRLVELATLGKILGRYGS